MKTTALNYYKFDNTIKRRLKKTYLKSKYDFNFNCTIFYIYFLR